MSLKLTVVVKTPRLTDKLENRNSTILFLLLCNQKYLVYMTLYYIILYYDLACIFIQPCFTYQLDRLHSPLFVAFPCSI